MSVVVGTAEVGDAEGIVRVWVDGWRWAYEGIVPASYLARLSPADPERIRLRRQRIADQAADGVGRTLVARDGAAVVGFAQVGPYRINQGPTFAETEGEVYALYIARERTGTGVGRALMDAGLAALREGTLAPVRLWVLERNVRARRFYERYGFRLDEDRSTFTLEEPGKLPVDLPEVRYTLRLT